MNGMRGNSFCWHKRHLGHFIKNTNCRDSKWKWTKLNWTRTKAGHYAAFLIIWCSYFDLKFGMRCKRSLWQSNSNERTNKKICCCYGTVSFMNISSAHPKHWLCLFLFHHQKKKRRGKKNKLKQHKTIDGTKNASKMDLKVEMNGKTFYLKMRNSTNRPNRK